MFYRLELEENTGVTAAARVRGGVVTIGRSAIRVSTAVHDWKFVFLGGNGKLKVKKVEA
jgi:hypothetical protein